MRAIICERFSSYQDLRQAEVERPPIAENSVRIGVHYASVSYAISLMVSGRYQRKMPLPFIPGTEVSGIVLECGAGVVKVKPGDPVAAIVDAGAYAEEVVTHSANVYPVPSDLSLKKAVGVPLSFGTAATALQRARVIPGQTVLVTGAGGALGMAAVKIAKVMGAKVIAAASTEEKLQAAKGAGADYGVNYQTEDLRTAVKAMTAGRGADVVFDPVGGRDFESLIRSTAIEGIILSLGFASGDIPAAPVNLLLVKNLTLMGVNFSEYIGWGTTDRREEFEGRIQELMVWLFTEIANQAIELSEPQIFPFDQFKEAIDSVVNRRAVGKVALKIRQ